MTWTTVGSKPWHSYPYTKLAPQWLIRKMLSTTRSFSTYSPERWLFALSGMSKCVVDSYHFTPTESWIARNSCYTDRWLLRLDKRAIEGAKKALQYQILEEIMEDWSGTSISITLASAFYFVCPARTASTHGPRPKSPLVLYRCIFLKLLPPYQECYLCFSSSIVYDSDKTISSNQPINQSGLLSAAASHESYNEASFTTLKRLMRHYR